MSKGQGHERKPTIKKIPPGETEIVKSAPSKNKPGTIFVLSEKSQKEQAR